MLQLSVSSVIRRLVLLAAVIGMSGCAVLTGAKLITVNAEIPDDFPANGYSHAVFEALLKSYVDASGNVNYEIWHQSEHDVAALDSYLAAVSRFSPENAPQRFATRNDELAYWLYSYNAYVIKSILSRWPLDSVHDVKAPIEVVRGLGFFYSQRFLFGAKQYNLYAVENDKIRESFEDARIHFVLNCGSDSCPILRPELPTGEALEPFLSAAAAEFVSDSRNVSIDHENRTIVLNEIFDWFMKDFVNDLKRRAIPSSNGLVDYIASVAPPSMHEDLLLALDYRVTFADYDWSVNQSKTESVH